MPHGPIIQTAVRGMGSSPIFVYHRDCHFLPTLKVGRITECRTTGIRVVQ